MSNFDDSMLPAGATFRKAIEALAAALAEFPIQYAIIGGLAVMQHSRLRTTDDIDLLLLVPQIQLPSLFEALSKHGFVVEIERNIRELREGITTIQFGDIVVDLMFPVIPAYTHVLDRAESVELFGHAMRIASVEGLLVTKLISYRLQDQADIRDLLASYGHKLDLRFIRAEMESFMLADDQRRAEFEALVKKFAEE